MGRVLLIVDDTPAIARGWRRMLKSHFDAVHIAITPREADDVLAHTQAPPTHLLCDFYLGLENPPTPELIAGWKTRHASLEKIVLVSGSHLSGMPVPPEVDAMFEKPRDLDRVLLYLAGKP